MKVTVRFSGIFRSLAGVKSCDMEVEPGCTLRGLFDCLERGLPASFSEQVTRRVVCGEAPLTLLLVNRVHIESLAGLDRSLSDGDVIAFVPPMEGG